MFNKKILLALIFFISLLINVVGINKQGETWDEIAYFNAAKTYYRNLRHFDFNVNSWEANKEHPAVGKWVLGIGSLGAFKNNEVNYTGGRLVNALLAAATAGIALLASLAITESLAAGAIAGLLTATFPMFVGLSKVYGLDIPTAFFFTLVAYLLILGLKTKQEKFFSWCAVATALTVSTRLIGLLLFPLIFFATLIFIKEFQKKDKKYLRHLGKFIVIFPVVTLIIFIATYPWFWGDTLAHLNKMIGHWGSVNEILFGKVAIPGKMYFVYYLLAVTPTLTLVGLFTSVVWTALKPSRWSGVIAVWFLAPFVWSFSFLKQDGLRYLIMIVPALAVWISYTWHQLQPKFRLAADLAIVLILGLQFIGLLKIYPYYLDYYNAAVGGPARVYAERNYQISWWGEGLYRAGQWLNANAPSGSTVAIKALPNHTLGKLKPDLSVVDDQVSAPDYIVENANFAWYSNYTAPSNYELVFQEKAGGAPLFGIWKKK